MLRKPVNYVLDSSSSREPNTIKINSLLAGGPYYSNPNFRYLEDKKIKLGIKVEKNSIVSPKNYRLRNRETILQTKDLLKWKKKRKYGHRWISETAFSTIKIMFGEYIGHQVSKHGKRDDDRISLYNLFRRI